MRNASIMTRQADASPVDDQVVTTENSAEVGSVPHRVDQSLDSRRVRHVVTILNSEIGALGRRDGSIQRHRLTLVPLTDHRQSSVGDRALEVVDASVGASVVDDDHVEVGVCLVEDAADCFDQKGARVERRNGNRDDFSVIVVRSRRLSLRRMAHLCAL
jgi:hypothetical protein